MTGLCWRYLTVMFSILPRGPTYQNLQYRKPSPQQTEDCVFLGFQDVHLLIFLGFGLLVAFLKRYTCSAIGYNLLIAAVVIQWGIFIHELIVYRMPHIVIDMKT